MLIGIRVFILLQVEAKKESEVLILRSGLQELSAEVEKLMQENEQLISRQQKVRKNAL